MVVPVCLGNGWKKKQKKRVNGRRGRRGTERRICRPRTYHPVGFGGSWAFLVPRWKPNRGFEVWNPAGALRTPTPTVPRPTLCRAVARIASRRRKTRWPRYHPSCSISPPPPPKLANPTLSLPYLYLHAHLPTTYHLAALSPLPSVGLILTTYVHTYVGRFQKLAAARRPLRSMPRPLPRLDAAAWYGSHEISFQVTFRSDDTTVPNTLPAFTLPGISKTNGRSDYDIEFLLLIPTLPVPVPAYGLHK